MDWINANLSNVFSARINITWSRLWATATWKIWSWRNASIHSEDFRRPTSPLNVIQQVLSDYDKGKVMLSLPIPLPPISDIRVAWNMPPDGWVKINSDGALKLDRSCAGCGGVIRDSLGQWIGGFYRCLGRCSVLKAEAWGLLEGIKMVVELGFDRVEFESDSLLLVNMIHGRWARSLEICGILREIEQRLRGFRCWKVRHKWREANGCADFLAALGCEASMDGQPVRLSSPPVELRSLLFRDALGAGVVRKVRDG